MVFKYFVKMDEGGEIGCFCKAKPKDCLERCKEYIIRLQEIEREEEVISVNSFTKNVDKLHKETVKLTSEVKKVKDKLRKVFK